jgi:hypothetical protein
MKAPRRARTSPGSVKQEGRPFADQGGPARSVAKQKMAFSLPLFTVRPRRVVLRSPHSPGPMLGDFLWTDGDNHAIL